MNDSEFDIIVVGCGPSVIGLLYGILSRSDLSHLSVAVVDVGSTDNSARSSNENESVRQWFQTSHPFPPWFGRRRSNVHSFMTVPQTHLGNRIIDVPVGIGHGGGTNINAGFCDGPFYRHKEFHHEWPKPWSDGSLLNDAVEKLQHTMKQNGGLTKWNMCDEYARHFAAGATRNTGRASNNTKENTTTTAFEHLLPVDTECNYLTSFPIATNNQFKRINYFDSLLSPLLLTTAKTRDRITFISNAAVYQIIIEDNQAIGIKYKDTTRAKTDKAHDVFTTLRAKKEIFLCTGAIISPALLLASGLGDKEQLQKSNIVPASGHDGRGNLPHVGKHLKDHVLLPRCFFTPINQWGIKKSSNCCQAKYNIRIHRKTTTSNEDKSTSTTESRTEETKMSQNYQFMLTDGAVSLDVLPYFLASYVRRGMHIQLDDSRAIALMKKIINTLCINFFLILRFLLWIIFSYIPLAQILVQHFTSTINICHMNPTSEGTIAVRKHSLGSAQPQQQRGKLLLDDIEILIDLCYMSNPSDYDAMHTAWHVSDVIRAQHFSNCFEVLPGFLYRWRTMIRRRSGIVSSSTTKPRSHHELKQQQRQDDIYWLQNYIRDFTLPYYHWCGTCRMGKTAQDSVVNSSLQVHGISGLRVCDASVFPTCISSPIALTCAAIGYVAASFLTP